MNGVIAVRSLFVSDMRVTALVPPERIAAGTLPQGTALPAIALMSIGSVDRNIPSPGPKRRVTERVQVTVLARAYPEAKAIIAASTTPRQVISCFFIILFLLRPGSSLA